MEFMLAEHAFPMPVGRVEYLHMGPMTFTEFLRGTGKDRLAGEVEGIEWPSGSRAPEIDPLIHRRLLEALRLYQFVGGMPEAVGVYAETASLRAVSAVHAGIIETYRDGLPQVRRPPVTSPGMLRVFNYAARRAGCKVKYSNVSPDDQSGTIRRDVELLAMARVVARVTHSHCSGLPLQGDTKDNVFKLIFLDVGLMNAICGLGWESMASRPDADLVNAGAGAEQFIGQHLQYLLAERPNRELTYWAPRGPVEQRRGGLRGGVRRPRRAHRGESRPRRRLEVPAPVRGREARTSGRPFRRQPPVAANGGHQDSARRRFRAGAVCAAVAAPVSGRTPASDAPRADGGIVISGPARVWPRRRYPGRSDLSGSPMPAARDDDSGDIPK